jgi:hypothetical protein
MFATDTFIIKYRVHQGVHIQLVTEMLKKQKYMKGESNEQIC